MTIYDKESREQLYKFNICGHRGPQLDFKIFCIEVNLRLLEPNSKLMFTYN